MNYNFYIDESCHLEHDQSNVMCIGVDDKNIRYYERLYNRRLI